MFRAKKEAFKKYLMDPNARSGSYRLESSSSFIFRFQMADPYSMFGLTDMYHVKIAQKCLVAGMVLEPGPDM